MKKKHSQQKREVSVYSIMKSPEDIGRMIGFNDLTPLHGEWISEMVLGQEDYTLQAHRGSYKSSCLAVSIALIMVMYPKRNIIFLRKTDNDVAEMMGMVNKILRSDFFNHLSIMMWDRELRIVSE